MIEPDSVFHIGRIGKPHGVKGEVSFHFSDDVFDRVDAEYLFLEVEGLLVPFFMEEYRFKSDTTALMKFCDIDDANQASQLTGCDVYFPRDLADEDDGELTWAEIVGFTITNHATHEIVGEVIAVDTSTINTLFEVKTPVGETVLIPAADDLVANVDREGRTIDLHIPDGLI